MPLKAIINGEMVVAPDVSHESWLELKRQHKKGLSVLMSCGAKGHLRTSKHGLQHFYHATDSEKCNCESESLAHIEIKNEIYQICKSAGWSSQVEYTSEKGDWRADVFTEKGDKKIVFEVQLTKIPLEILEDRDIKYRDAGIESYWLLKGKSGYPLSDYRYFDEQIAELCYVDSFWSSDPDAENPNQYKFFIPKGIFGIDINPQTRLLDTGISENISISSWINSVLDGVFQSDLDKISEEYEYLSTVRKVAKTILQDVHSSHERIKTLFNELKRQYAIFKSNSLNDFPQIRDNIHTCYEYKKEINKFFFGQVLSTKLGWKWIQVSYLSYTIHVLHLQSFEQIFEIQKRSKEASEKIDKFESLLKTISADIGSNIKKELKQNTQYKEKLRPAPPSPAIMPDIRVTPKQIKPKKVESSGKHEDESRLISDEEWKRNIELAAEKNLQWIIRKNLEENNPDDLIEFEELITFEVNINLKTNLLESSNGKKHHVVPGLPIRLDARTAQEFEGKGYGYIVKK